MTRRRAAVRPLLEALEGRRLLSARLNGLLGQYFDDAGFARLAMERTDAAIDFDFGTGAPVDVMGEDTFSAKWAGTLVAPAAGEYRFAVDADGPATLRVRGIDALARSIRLRAGQAVDLELAYHHDIGPARVRLLWQVPGAASFETVPAGALRATRSPDVTFQNPVAAVGADPFVTRHGDQYVYVRSDGRSIRVAMGRALQEVFAAPAQQVWAAPPYGPLSQNVWAPELFFLDGHWWIYFAADDGDNANHRMYALKSAGGDPQGPYEYAGKVAAATDRWAIDGTVLEHGGRRYFLWSGWEGFADGQQDLYIAEMSDPATIVGDRVRIGTPQLDWERHGLPINEGPQILQEGGRTHVVYSGSGFWTQQYALGRLTLDAGGDPLDPSAWREHPEPVFAGNEHARGVGHASFTPSPDGREWWVAYHAHDDAAWFGGGRDVRLQRFAFADGVPIFGEPVAPGARLDQPSGTPRLYDLPPEAPEPAAAVPAIRRGLVRRPIDLFADYRAPQRRAVTEALFNAAFTGKLNSWSFSDSR